MKQPARVLLDFFESFQKNKVRDITNVFILNIFYCVITQNHKCIFVQTVDLIIVHCDVQYNLPALTLLR